MNKTLNTILKCIGSAILAFLLVNTIYFLVDILQNGIGQSWSFRFKHGAFYNGEKPTGMVLGQAKANLFLALMFGLALFQNYRKGNFAKA